MLGTPLMPWQQLVADVSLELVPAGDDVVGIDASGLGRPGLWVPAYREVIVTVMRQCGKSTLVLSVIVDRAVSWVESMRMVYTAQTAQEARRKLLEDWEPVLTSKRNKLRSAISNVRKQSGSEGVKFVDGSSLAIIPRDGSAGHGRTLDFGVIDEAFDDVDFRGEQAMSPAMITRPQAQKWILSTQGTDASIFLNTKTALGRSLVEQGKTEDTAYFEWSVPLDEDIDDPAVWAQYVPAFGRTISEAALRHERTTMPEAEFKRAYMNQRTAGTDDGPIPLGAWGLISTPDAEPADQLQYGLDVAADRSRASIAVIGQGVGELVESRDGVGWIVERTAEIIRKNPGVVMIDGNGPAVPFVIPLRNQGVYVEELDGPDYAASCARLFDAIVEAKIRVREDDRLTEAVRVLRKRPGGDRFAWSRSKSTGDITPLVALTMAYGPADVLFPPPDIF